MQSGELSAPSPARGEGIERALSFFGATPVLNPRGIIANEMSPNREVLMILDRLENAARYVSLHPAFATAFKWLREQDCNALPLGRTDIDGDRLYASVQREPGRGQDAAKFETHRRYIDTVSYTHLTLPTKRIV